MLGNTFVSFFPIEVSVLDRPTDRPTDPPRAGPVRYVWLICAEHAAGWMIHQTLGGPDH